MTSKFYSSLIINTRKFPGTYQVFKPRYNKIYYKRLYDNLSQIETQLKERCQSLSPDEVRASIKLLRDNLPNLVGLSERFEKLVGTGKFDEENPKHVELRTEFEDAQDKVLPVAVCLPNRASKEVPKEDFVVDKVESGFQSKRNLAKVLNYKKLSFINNCFFKSVVGPNSHYYVGIGAKLQHGLQNFFIDELEKNCFILTSGLCLTKSAVVEATNSVYTKCYLTDPCRILKNEAAVTALHLTEASIESLVGFINSLGPRSSNEPLRIMTSGAGYRNGYDWFDPDDRKVSQFETVHCLSLNASVEQYSRKEYQHFKNIVWSIYKKLQLPLRLIHCSLETMRPNEYDAHRIDVWLPSLHQWVEVGRISYYLDHITVRTGMKRGHIIDSMAYDGRVLVAAIIENNQTPLGKFTIPAVIKSHMSSLTPNEGVDYFNHEEEKFVIPDFAVGLNPKNLHNFEQRRYMRHKRFYAFSHSEAADKMHRGNIIARMIFPLASLVIICVLIDWVEVWYQFIPTRLQRFLYDKLYVNGKHFKNYFVYKDGETPPPVLKFDEIDKTPYKMTVAERKKRDYAGRVSGETFVPGVIIDPAPPEERYWLFEEKSSKVK